MSEYLKLFLRLLYSVAIPTGVTIVSLYIFNQMANIKYLPASGLAFGTGFFVLYLVFKYVIKPDATEDTLKRIRRYSVLFIIDLALNTEIVYLLVTYVGVPILTAQLVAAVVIAYESYYAYLSLVNGGNTRVMLRRPQKLDDDIIYYDDTGSKIEV